MHTSPSPSFWHGRSAHTPSPPSPPPLLQRSSDADEDDDSEQSPQQPHHHHHASAASKQHHHACSSAAATSGDEQGGEEGEEEGVDGAAGSHLSADDTEMAEDEDMYEQVFCRNCTADMFGGVCQACGHHANHDAAIFSGTAHASYETQLPAWPKPVALLWDERMALHEEGKVQPHPERPDRLRAVMARVMASGLAGEWMMCV